MFEAVCVQQHYCICVASYDVKKPSAGVIKNNLQVRMQFVEGDPMVPVPKAKGMCGVGAHTGYVSPGCAPTGFPTVRRNRPKPKVTRREMVLGVVSS